MKSIFLTAVALLAVIALNALHVKAALSSPRMAEEKNKKAFYLNIGGMKSIQEWNVTAALGGTGGIYNGDVIIFSTWFGVYPEIRPTNGQWCNGGIPQLANLSLHQETIVKDINWMKVPMNFTGYFVNDYESWVPSWVHTGEVYKNASMAYALEQDPSLAKNHTALEQVAKQHYETAAVEFLVATIRTIRKARPHAKGYGFYGYPTTYSYWTIDWNQIEESNDALLPLWKEVTAFYPSLYLPYMSGMDMPYERNKLYLSQKMYECQRLNDKFFDGVEGSSMAKRLVLPYTWYRYHPGEPHGWELLTDQDTFLEFDYLFNWTFSKPNVTQPFSGSADGAIIWGSESNASDVKAVEDYLIKHKDNFIWPTHEAATRVHATSDASHDNMMMDREHDDYHQQQSSSVSSSSSSAAQRAIFSATTENLPPWKRCGL